MFESGSVKHHFRSSLLEDLRDSFDVPQVSEQEIGTVEQGATFDRQLHGVKRRLVTVEHQER